MSATAIPYPIADAQFLYAIAPGGSAPESDIPEIAFAGRSNVGKSSLLNRLLNRRNLVRTSSTPGCTRQINIFQARLQPDRLLRLVDLPGFGFARRSKSERVQWGGLIENYLSHRTALKLVVLLVDARRGVEEEEKMLIDFLQQTRSTKPVEILCVATKIDKLGRSQAATLTSSLRKSAGVRVVAFSAQTGEGREEVWREILRILK